MQITVLMEKDESAYTNFLLRFERSSMVASLLFRDFLQKMTYPSIPYYLVAKEGEDIVGVLPAFLKKGKYGSVLNSLPWFGSNPGVISNDVEAASLLVGAFLKTAEWTDCLSATLIAAPFDEFQEDEIYSASFSGGLVDSRVGAVTILSNFSGFELHNQLEKRIKEDQSISDRINDMDEYPITELFKSIHSKTRNQIRKSYKENFVGRCNPDRPLIENAALDFLMQAHKDNMQKIGGPVKSKEFEIIGKWQVGKDCNLYVSRQKETGHHTAALLVVYFNKTVDYWVPAISVDYRHLCPLHGLIFQAMTDAAKRGFKYWNWGGTTIPGMEDVLHFKTRFGGQTCEYKYYTKMFKTLPAAIDEKDLMATYPYFYVMPKKFIGWGLSGRGAKHGS